MSLRPPTDKLVLQRRSMPATRDAMRFEEERRSIGQDLRNWKIIDKAIQGELVKALSKGRGTRCSCAVNWLTISRRNRASRNSGA